MTKISAAKMTNVRDEISFLDRLDPAFDRVAAEYPFPNYLSEASRHQLRAIATALDSLLEDKRKPKLLDVGSGPLDKTAVLQRMGFDCSAVDDLSDPWHLLADNRIRILDFAEREGIRFHLQSEDDYAIPFATESFDIVTSIAVIEHLHDSPRHIINAMTKHLRTGGLLVVVMPNAVNLRKRLDVVRGRTNYNPLGELYHSLGSYRGHVREYTLSETRDICELSGLEVRHASTFDHLGDTLPFGLRHIYRLAGKLDPTLLTGLLVIAEKPEGWVEVAEDPESYFRAIGGATPYNFAKADLQNS